MAESRGCCKIRRVRVSSPPKRGTADSLFLGVLLIPLMIDKQSLSNGIAVPNPRDFIQTQKLLA
jgi:hypothetical protein